MNEYKHTSTGHERLSRVQWLLDFALTQTHPETRSWNFKRQGHSNPPTTKPVVRRQRTVPAAPAAITGDFLPLGKVAALGQAREGREHFYNLRIMIQRVLRQKILQNLWATFLHQKKFLHICSGPWWWPTPPACGRWESCHISGNSTPPFTTSLVSNLRIKVPL